MIIDQEAIARIISAAGAYHSVSNEVVIFGEELVTDLADHFERETRCGHLLPGEDHRCLPFDRDRFVAACAPAV